MPYIAITSSMKPPHVHSSWIASWPKSIGIGPLMPPPW